MVLHRCQFLFVSVTSAMDAPKTDESPALDPAVDEGDIIEAKAELPPRIDVLYQLHATEADQAAGHALLQHCRDGSVESVKQLVREGAPVCFVTTSGWTPLAVASFNGHLELVQYLLSIGAGGYYKEQQQAPSSPSSQGNKKCNLQNTPLHWACYKGYPQVVAALFAFGFSVDDADSSGNRALHLACSNGNFSVLHIVLAHTTDFAAKNMYGNTPLDMTTDIVTRKLLKKLQAQSTCETCKELFSRTRRPTLCHQCHAINCDIDPCTTSVEVPWSADDSAVHSVRYCRTCIQFLTRVEMELEAVLAAKTSHISESLVKIHELELEVRAAAIPTAISTEDATSVISQVEPVAKDVQVKALIQALGQLDSDVADIEALKTAISDAQEKSANAWLIKRASESYKQLTAHTALVNEIKRLLVERPIKVRSSIDFLRKSWRDAKAEHVSPILVEAAQRVIVMAESEVTLYGYYMLSARIDVGSKVYLKDMTKLANAISTVEDKGVNETLLRNARVLRDKLFAEMAMEDALMNFEAQNDGSFAFIDGTRCSTLLEALNHRNHVVTMAVETATKMEDSTPISQTMMDQAKELLIKLKKDIKDEQKHEDERRKLEEEEAAKKAKKGKKGKKKA
ncbi:hypothetical protein LEN26_018738 [Aphanomyces euteiches]|nr:hypothetical protein LEN26_018738 [Aphanomyces euteiches]